MKEKYFETALKHYRNVRATAHSPRQARLALVKNGLVSDNRTHSTENQGAKREVNRGVLVRLS